MGLEERVGKLRKTLVRAGLVGEGIEMLTVVCNGCKFAISATTMPELELLVRGWSLGGHAEGRDFCPRCAKGNEDADRNGNRRTN